MVLSTQHLQSKPPKGMNPNHANKRVEFEHGGNCLFTNHCHKDIGRSNMCITDVAIMVAQYAKRNHIKSKGVMAISE